MAAFCQKCLVSRHLKSKLVFQGRGLLCQKKCLSSLTTKRQLSTLSAPLAAAFNTKPAYKLNFNFGVGCGLFRIMELQEFSGFHILKEQAEAEVESLVEEITSPNRTKSVVTLFDELSDCLCKVADLADFVRVSHPDPMFAQAAEDTCVYLSGIVEKLNTNPDIYHTLKNAVEEGDVVPLDDLDKRVGKLFQFDHEQSGIHLAEDKRAAFVKLNEDVMMIGNFFMQGTHVMRNVPKSMLPENIRHFFNVDGDHVQVYSLHSDHYNERMREAAYKIYLYPDKHQEHLLMSLLHSRHKLAQVVGFETFAHRTIKGTMAETPENVMDFLENLADSIRPRADADYADMRRLKLAEGGIENSILAWDPPYYSAKGRQLVSNLKSYEVMPYFSIGGCMEGLSNLYKCLFNVTLQNVKLENGEAWAKDIHKLAVVHESEGVLGYIYCDFFERPDKPPQDCHYTIQGGRQKQDGQYQLPIVVLQLNFSASRSNVPSLLTHGMMENLFHEFGHAMHSMLGRTKYQHVTGTRCPTDFAEVPSILMEYFVSDPRVLSTFAFHHKTGEPLPMEQIQKLCEAKRLYAASDMQVQVLSSITDQVFHSRFPFEKNKSTTQVMADLHKKYYSIPYVDNAAWQLRFGHLVGYGAKYYSYLMSRGVAARIWHKCFKDDPFNRQMGERFREKMLSHGGEIAPGLLVQSMLQETQELTMNQLVESLIQDLDSS
ncbi:mitochondrial intermediate peptidase-like [Mizuhopecten yessoensis]|uniref:Mitochondrial intermediate peptidase n=1 Tax=Mizuhopecten yessoensis TaxID=6573 RepID=A0A210R6M9_MIZYE|nr:mitochondrial intermediate peptidase-like [Mizuhopecten yessoensis]OWF56707.1 Mitochondrial intermediate peptidase [Mizuhopecten yessoensis]